MSTNSAMVNEDGLPLPDDDTATGITPRLMAVLEVDKSERVYCAQPGCNHTVYKAIHVVKEGENLLVLGSTCFQKRYGGSTALGNAQHRGGNGRVLTSEERALLAENTRELLARFEAEETLLRQKAELKLQILREATSRPLQVSRALVEQPVQRSVAWSTVPRGVFPWPWMKRGTSVAAFKLKDGGGGWVRVQHNDGRQFVVPWPSFIGWDEALPPVVGRPNLEAGGYEIMGGVPAAIEYLRGCAEREKVTGYGAMW